MVKSALESLDGVGPRVAEFFSWAEREEDIVKKFILYFISLEMFSHKEFKLNFGNRTADEMEQMVGSAESNFPVSSEWLLKRKQREWTTLQERFVAGVMLRVRTCKFALQPVRGLIHFSKKGECHERRFLVDRGAAFASEALLSEAEGQAPGR